MTVPWFFSARYCLHLCMPYNFSPQIHRDGAAVSEEEMVYFLMSTTKRMVTTPAFSCYPFLLSLAFCPFGSRSSIERRSHTTVIITSLVIMSKVEPIGLATGWSFLLLLVHVRATGVSIGGCCQVYGSNNVDIVVSTTMDWPIVLEANSGCRYVVQFCASCYTDLVSPHRSRNKQFSFSPTSPWPN